MRPSRLARRLAAHICSVAVLLAAPAYGEEVRVMTSGGTAAAYVALAPQFERATGHTAVTLATSTGIGPDAIANRVRRGEPVDVIILSRAGIDELVGEGKVVAASRVDLARSSIGMAVRRGAPKPDISTVDALKRALLQAKSVAYSAQVSGSYLTTELFPRLGIADQMAKKSIRVDVGRVGAASSEERRRSAFSRSASCWRFKASTSRAAASRSARVTVFTAAIAAVEKSHCRPGAD